MGKCFFILNAMFLKKLLCTIFCNIELISLKLRNIKFRGYYAAIKSFFHLHQYFVSIVSKDLKLSEI